MSFEDFTKNFSQLEICNLGPDSTTNSSKKRFQMSAQDGGWKKKTNAGGCRNYRGRYNLLSTLATVSEIRLLSITTERPVCV